MSKQRSREEIIKEVETWKTTGREDKLFYELLMDIRDNTQSNEEVNKPWNCDYCGNPLLKCVCEEEPQIDQYTVDKILEKIAYKVNGDENWVDVYNIVKSFKK